MLGYSGCGWGKRSDDTMSCASRDSLEHHHSRQLSKPRRRQSKLANEDPSFHGALDPFILFRAWQLPWALTEGSQTNNGNRSHLLPNDELERRANVVFALQAASRAQPTATAVLHDDRENRRAVFAESIFVVPAQAFRVCALAVSVGEEAMIAGFSTRIYSGLVSVSTMRRG